MLVYLVTDLTIVLLCGFTVCCFARVIIIRVLEHLALCDVVVLCLLFRTIILTRVSFVAMRASTCNTHKHNSALIIDRLATT
jgi:hypothetical protein